MFYKMGSGIREMYRGRDSVMEVKEIMGWVSKWAHNIWRCDGDGGYALNR